MIILKILYLLCCIIIIKVSDSQQFTIPVQAYSNQQQIPYNSVQQNVPVLIQPSNNNNHYLQANTAQNIIPNDLAKVVISKILSSPSIHKYLDPNTRHCRQNDIELLKHGCNTGPIPHVTNNYFIVPPEYLKLNNSEVASEKITPKLFKRVESDVVGIPVEIKNYLEDNNKYTKTNQDSSVHNTSNGARDLVKVNKKHRRKRPRQRIKKKITLEKNTENDINNREKSGTETINGNLIETDSAPDDTFHEDDIKPKNSSETKKTQNNNTRKRTRQRKRGKRLKIDETATSSHVNKTNEKELSSNMDTSAETELNTDTQNSIEENHVKPETERKSEYLHTLHIISNKNPTSNENVEISETSKSKNDDRRVTKHCKDDLIVRDFKQKFPEVPETLVRTMLAYVQSELQNHFATNFFYPGGGGPFGFEQLYQMPQLLNQGWSHVNERKNKSKNRRRKQKHRKGSSKRRNNRKNKPKVSKNAEVNNELSLSMIESEENTEKVTTETISLSQLKESPDFSQNFSEEISELLEPPTEETKYPTSKECIETNRYDNELSLEEIEVNYNVDDPYTREIYEEDDFVPSIYDNRLIDDYYPIFTDNPEAFEPDEYHVKNLNDRYYYTTDKNKDNIYYEEINQPSIYEEIKKPHRNFKDDIPKLLKYNFKDNSLKHTYFDVDREGFKNLARELPKQLPLLKPKTEIQKTGYIEETGFKSPPALEFPDFITRKIDKPSKLQEYRLDDCDEINKYDDLADDQDLESLNALRENSGNKKIKSHEKSKDIETVYANSKVVKYGADREHENSAKFINEDNNNFNNERISYVIGKSLANPDEVR